MGYFQKRHGEQTNTMTSTGRSYYRERHQKEIPKSQNVLQRALKVGGGIAKDIGTSMLPPKVQPGFMGGLSTGLESVSSPIEKMGTVVSDASARAQFPDEGVNQELAKLGYGLGAGVISGGFGGRKAIASLASKGLQPFKNVATKARRVETVSNIGKQLSKKRWSTLPRWFERQINKFSSANPDETIDISRVIKDATIASVDDPKLASIMRHPVMRELSENPDKAKYMTLKEVQALKNIATESVPESIKSGVKGSPKFRGTNSFTKLINQKITDSFPEMKEVARKYGEKAEQFKEFAPAFRGAKKVEKTLGKQGIFTYFGSPDYLGGESAQSAIKAFSPRLAKGIGTARRANQILNATKIGGVGYAATKIPGISWPFRRISEHLID